MLGPIIIVVVLVLVIPVGFLMSTAVAAGTLGFLLKDNGEKSAGDSELIDTNH